MNSKKKYIYFTILVSIINLILIFLLKYYGNDLSFNNFSLLKVGNFLNISFTTILILTSLYLLKKISKISEIHFKIVFFLSISYFLPLLILFFLNLLHFEFSDKYLFGYPFRKIIPLLFFLFSQLLQFYVIFILLSFAFKRRLTLYFYSFFYVGILVTLLLVFSFLSTYNVKEHNFKLPENKLDYGIVLGAAVWSNNKPSTLFMARIDKCALLYLNNNIEKIHLTGGSAPGEVSEAKSAFLYLTEKYKITPGDIILEEKTSTTNEQIRYIKTKFNIFTTKKKYLFISDKFHLKRISEMIDFYNLNAEVISSDYNLTLNKTFYYRLRDSIGLLLFWFFAI
ncbi:MAG: hypothetical protein CR986_07580 [Ignavibacteriae bacterium]|nr:MAG: hypothetical protein CR986_07580 [Ignavibacteriota bacterium]